MSFPIIWEKYNNYILCDIKESLVDKAKDFVLKYYVEEDIICKLIKYTHEENYAADHNFYLDHIFRDQCSLVILDEKTDEIIAAVMMKTMTKEMRSWTAIRLVSKNRKLNSLLTITRQLISDADKKLNSPTGSMHILELCERPNYAENSTANWMSILFYGAYRVAQSLKMPLLTFVGYSKSEQAAAVAADFTEITRIFYPAYTEMDGHRPIPSSDCGEMYAVLYYKDVKPFVPYYDLP